MNSFGRLFRIHIFGESHGAGIGAVIDGCPAGVPLTHEDLLPDLSRRRPCGRGTTPRREEDMPQFMSGIKNGHTTGSPITVWIANHDVRSEDYADMEWTPRPGHADFTAKIKFGGWNDARGGGPFSGRITAGLTAAGAVAKKILGPIEIRADLLHAGGTENIESKVKEAESQNDSLGGLVQCTATGLPSGLGEPFFDSAESLISHLAFAVPGIRGIEFGTGFASAEMKGSECNDALIDVDGRTASNHSGGINGGLTNGNPLIFQVAVKPPSSIGQPQQTINLRTGKQSTLSIGGRHDVCIALRMPVIMESVAAVVLADLMLMEQNILKTWSITNESAGNQKKNRSC